ncbi:MAG: trehalose operon repressor [Aerococcus sp.]|nr:trehalose operon repressor [Aerococcus sp.]
MAHVKADMIAQDIATKIKHNIYPADSFLPSENQLTELYGASRVTVRKALAQLMDLGLIQKIQGKGSKVLNLERYTFPLSSITSFQELNQQLGMHATTELLTFQTHDTLPETFKPYFEEEADARGYEVERLRLIDGESYVLDQDYVLNPPITNLTADVAQGSLYAHFEEDLGLDISYATKEINVIKVPNRVHDLLKLDQELAVVVISRNYLSDTTKFQLTLSYHRPDRFRFVDFARRQRLSL